MFGITENFKEKQRVKQNLEEIEKNQQDAFADFDSACRYYAECLENKDVEEKVMYEPGRGEEQFQICCALFEAFTKRLDFTDYTHILILHKKKEISFLKKKYGAYENVEFWLLRDDIPMKYYRLLATAKYLFSGKNFPYLFVKRKEQFYLNIQSLNETKAVGYEGESDYFRIANHIRNILMADSVLVKDETAYRHLLKSYRLEGIFEGTVWIADATEQAAEILLTALNGTSDVRIEKDFSTRKKKLLIYGGGMAVNGVTEALLALLNAIDYTRYDVTLFCHLKDGVYSRRNIDRVAREVRTIVTRGADPMTKEEQLLILYLKQYGICCAEEEKIYEKCRYLLQRAAFRRLGQVSFDTVIDFSGYAVWVPLILLEIPAKKRLIWQHNDLKEDFSVVNDGRKKHGNVRLEGLCSMYRRFDRIVSVNQPLMEINKRKLGEEDTKERFCYVTNILDTKRLEEKIAETQNDCFWKGADGRTYLICDNARTSVDGTMKLLPFEKGQDAFYFVTMGRLSQEKNHANLILAFREFLKEYPKSRLFIIGKGVLMDSLQAQAAKNKMEKDVIFTGNLSNPYLLMKNCDCFVFPSYMEGQGLAVLEARALGMPIVISDYEVSASVCVEGGQYVTGMEKEDILQGLLAYAKGEVPKEYAFSIDEYNQKAIEEFYRVIED